MTIFMGRKAWRNVVDAVGTSATREAGEQVIVDLALEDDVIERRTDEGRVRFGHPFFIGRSASHAKGHGTQRRA